MRIFHTADLHLASDDPETLGAVDTVLETAAEEGVDLLTIGGDLFDAPEDASRLRTDVRSRFSDQPFDIVAIPGNHDADVFERGFDLGTDIEIVTETPCSEITVDDVAIVGAPFTPRMTGELFSSLEATARDRDVRVLLLHCTLDVGFGRGAAGDEAEGRYMPVELATLGRLGYDFVLAGHIHVGYRAEELSNGGTFVYPGSPTSHSWSEEGRRHAALVDTDAGAVEAVELETPYRDRSAYTVTPGNQDAMPETIATWVDGHDLDRASLEMTVDGYADADERAYNDRLREAASPLAIDPEVKSVSEVLEHEIYAGVVDRLDAEIIEAYDRATVEGVEQLLIENMAPLLHGGEVR